MREREGWRKYHSWCTFSPRLVCRAVFWGLSFFICSYHSYMEQLLCSLWGKTRLGRELRGIRETVTIPQTLLHSSGKKRKKSYRKSFQRSLRRACVLFLHRFTVSFSEELFFMLRGLWVASPHKFRRLCRKSEQDGKCEMAEPCCSGQ